MKSRVDLRFTIPAATQAPAMDGVLALLQGQAPAASAVPQTVAQWQRQAASGSPQAQYELAKALTAQPKDSADNRAAVKWLRKASQQAHIESQHLLGVLVARGQGVRANPEEAVRLFRAAAIMGLSHAQYDLGRALSWGFGCEANAREALTWWRLAAAQGHAQAQLAVGRAYANGQGCDINVQQAAAWLRKAALNHVAEAAFELAHIYLRPDNAQANNRDAYRWMAEAARAGLAQAQYELALFFWSGRAVEQNHAQAFDWAKRAAAQNHVPALLLMSKMLASGLGHASDRALAYALALCAQRLAQDPSAESARLHASDLRATLTTQELEEGQSLHDKYPETADLLATLDSRTA